MRKTSDILSVAADRIEVPTSWTKGSNARDAAGNGIHPTDPRAKCFCLGGSIMREIGPTGRDPSLYHAVNDQLQRVGFGWNLISSFNDLYGREAVIGMARWKVQELQSLGL